MTGTIVKGVGGLYTVACAGGAYVCNARGLFRLRKVTPLIGDRVEIDAAADGTGVLKTILPRVNELVRPRAANVDICAVLCAPQPAPNLELLDVMLINAQAQGLAAMVCVTKTDLADNAFLSEMRNAYHAFPYCEISIPIREGSRGEPLAGVGAEPQGLSPLKSLIAGKTVVLAGVSGVGKSSLLNALADTALMATGGLSEKASRGKHTTRHAELIGLGDGAFVIDTPGFSNVTAMVRRDEVQRYYPEFAAHLGDCFYGDCLHVSEHDCAVKAQIGGGLDAERYKRYVSICGKLS